MSATLRQKFAYLRRIQTAVGGAEHAARSAHATFERGDWSSSVRGVERTTGIIDKVTALLGGEHPDMPAGFDLDTPEVRSYAARAEDARQASMVTAARLEPIQAQWIAQTSSASRYPLNGWAPSAVAAGADS